MANHPNRRMPKPAHQLPGDGGVDVGHFRSEMPNAEAALRSGETVIHSMTVQVLRTHHTGGPKGAGMNVDALLRIQAAIMKEVDAGTIKAASNYENGSDAADLFSVVLTAV